MVLIIVLILAVILYIKVKPYFIRYDTVVCFTGGLGSGKSFMSVDTALNLLSRNRWKVLFHNLFHPRNKWEMPMLYSNIPVRVSRREYALQLTEEHLLLQKAIIPRSVVFLDEVDGFANQQEYKNVNLLRLTDKEGGNFDEFVRLYRHYTLGGYFVVNTQCSENIVLTIRRRINTCFNLMYFRKWFFPPIIHILPPIFYTVKCRNISIGEEIKTIEEKNTEDNMRTLFGFFPWRRRYDTYCYSGRYTTVPFSDEYMWAKLKTNRMVACPSKVAKRITKTTDDEEAAE